MMNKEQFLWAAQKRAGKEIVDTAELSDESFIDVRAAYPEASAINIIALRILKRAAQQMSQKVK